MEIVVNSENNFSIFGSVKSEKNYEELKNLLEEKIEKGAKEFEFQMRHCFDLNSRILGYFLKIIDKDGVKITIKSKSEDLTTLLKNLALLDTFNIKKQE